MDLMLLSTRKYILILLLELIILIIIIIIINIINTALWAISEDRSKVQSRLHWFYR